MDFASLIAPLPPERFLQDHWGQRPLHLRADAIASRAAIMDWSGLNRIFALRGHWTPEHVQLIRNSAPIRPEFYVDDVPGLAGPRRLADPAKIEAFLAMGASFVVNAVEEASPEVRALTAALSDRFSARVSANLYCSFQGVQAFASHCDTHEVFAIHCAGAKRWRIYANRADNPLETLEGPDAQARIDAAKGAVLMDVTLQPGDLLYIPRGYFHDAMATAGESLHLTLGVAPHSGRALFDVLAEIAVSDSLFRAYLPDPRADGGSALAERLAALGARLAELAASPAVADAVANRQRMLVDAAPALDLPARPQLVFYARSDRPAEVDRRPSGAVLCCAAGSHSVGRLADAADYLLARPAFNLHELRAAFAHHDPDALAGLVAAAERLGLVQRYVPQR